LFDNITAWAISDHDRNDRAVDRLAGVEPGLLGALQKKCRVLAKPKQALRLTLEKMDRGDGRGGQRRGKPDRIDKAGRAGTQDIDESLRAGDISSRGRQGLGKGSHPNLDVGGIAPLFLRNAAAGAPEDADRMGLVHHQQSPRSAFHLDEAPRFGRRRHAVRPSRTTRTLAWRARCS
jgi:hypothetical protein